MIPQSPPPDMDPDDARRRVYDELSKGEYDDSPGFIPWLLGILDDWLKGVVNGIDGSSIAQAAVLALVTALGVTVVVLVLRRTGMIRRGASLSVESALDAQQQLSAEELLSAARDAIAASRVDDAAVLAMRSLVRDLDERTLLDVTAGMTAHEAASGAATAFPDLRGRLQRAADVFDTAAYSFRAVSAKQAEDLVRLAEYTAGTAPDLSAASPVSLTGQGESA